MLHVLQRVLFQQLSLPLILAGRLSAELVTGYFVNRSPTRILFCVSRQVVDPQARIDRSPGR